MPLEEGYEYDNVPTAKGRLIYGPIAAQANKKQKMWVYQVKDSPERAWRPAYCFNEVEFIPKDFDVMNWHVSTARNSWFTYRLVMMKMILHKERDEVVGTIIMMGNSLGRRLNGRKEELTTFKSDKERVDALGKWFGVELRAEEIRGIDGMVTQLDTGAEKE